MPFPLPLAGLNPAIAKWAVIALSAISLALGSYRHGRHVAEGEIAAAQRDIALAYAGRIVEQQDEADRLAEANAALRAAQDTKDRLITREITRYVEVTPHDLRCRLPGAFRLLHDAAAAGTPTAAEAGPLAAAIADPIEDTALLETLGHNYTTCRKAIAQVEAWQRRYHALESAREKAD